MISTKHVNPIDIKQLGQIHRVDGSLSAIPFNPDLLQAFANRELLRSAIPKNRYISKYSMIGLQNRMAGRMIRDDP